MILGVIAFATFLLSLFFVWLIGVLGYRRGWVVAPREERWSKRPVALYGGVGIFFAFASGVALLRIVTGREMIWPILLPPLALGGICIFALGVLDDKLHIKPATKLIGQIIAASIPIAAGLALAVTPWPWLNIVITFFWFLAIVNAVNLVDNMDGLAAGIVLISALTMLIRQFLTIGSPVMLIGVLGVLVGAVAGFWVFNRHPASIFMGDGGSLFLGYSLAGLAILTARGGALGSSSALFSLLLPVAVLAVPIFDTVLVTMMRLLHGRAVSKGGTDHSSHRLVGLGFSEKQAVTVLYSLAIVGGLVALFLQRRPNFSLTIIALYTLFLIFVGIYLSRVKVYREPNEKPAAAPWTPLVTNILYKRRVAEVLLDIILITVSYYLSYYLRFETATAIKDATPYFLQSLPIILPVCLFWFYVAGVYRGIWRLITVSDVGRYIKGVASGIGTSAFLLVLLFRFHGYSRAVFIIFGVLLFLMVVGSRLSFRILDDMVRRRTQRSRKVNVVIYGAGRGGKLLYEESSHNPDYQGYNIVGFIDDDANLQQLTMASLTIYGPEQFRRESAVQEMVIHEVWISSAKISPERVISFVDLLQQPTRPKIETRKLRISIEE